MDQNELLRLAAEHQQSGDLTAASELYQEVLAKNPRNREALYLSGRVARDTGDHLAASEFFRRSIAISAKQPEYHHALGLALMELGNHAEAESTLRHAIRLSSRPEYHHALGTLHRKQGRIPEAVVAYKHALKQDAAFAEAHYDLGNCYQDAGELAEAVTAYRNALRYRPDLIRAWYALGCAELGRKEYAPAVECFEKTLSLEPGWMEAEHNLARALFELGRTDEAVDHFRNCGAREDLLHSANAREMLALIIPGAPGADNAAILEARRAWAERDLTSRAGDVYVDSRVHVDSRERPLRVGYVSSFFHRRNWMKPVWGLINQHDRSEFEIHLFSDAPASKLHGGYRGDSRDRVHDITRVSNEEVRALIQNSGIDLLVDLNSYSKMARLPLFAWKPAPVCAAWFNLYATSGLDGFDYLIGDDQVIPAEEERFYTERIRRVSGSYLTFEVDYPVPDVTEPPCLTKGTITFGSLASQIKITGPVIAAWSGILRECPSSSLILGNTALGSATTREFMFSQFAANGIPSSRINLRGPAEHFEFLKVYNEIDIALDTFPYNGGTTTTEAIWQGVPVLTFWGDRWVSRTSASILRTGGLGEFVRADPDSYISFACELANSVETPERLAALRRSMRAQLMLSPVCDTKSFAREMEGIYKELCKA